MKKIIISILLVFVLGLSLTSAAVGDVTVTFSDTEETGNPADTVSYTLSLENTGLNESTISFTSTVLTDASSNEISAPTIDDVTYSAGASADVSYSVTIPSTAAGDYTGTLTVSDGANSEDFSYTITVSSVDSFSLDASEINLEMLSDEEEDSSFTITNDGSTTLSSWTVSFESEDGDADKIEDSDGDDISVDLSTPETSLAPGASMTIAVTVNVDSDVDPNGDYDGTISVSGTGSAEVTGEVQLNVDVSPSICEDGKQGSDWDITIDEPDSGDDFSPGESVTIEIDVENQGNDDMDAVIEIILYNEDEGKKELTVKEDISIDEDETDSFSIDFDLPTDLDDGDDFVLYVQVHEEGNEDDSCDYEEISIDIEREDEDARIIDTSVSPSTGLTCGEDYRVSVEVENVGTDELKDLYIEIVDGDLEVQESSSEFDLEDYNDADNDYKASFDLVVPTDLNSGNYYIEAILYDEDGDQIDDELILVDVDACSVTSTTDVADETLNVVVSQEYEVNGEDLTISLIVENTGTSSKVITVSVEDVSWADLEGSEYISNLNSGDSIHAYLYFGLDLTAEGEHDMQVTVTDDAGNEVSEIITVDFGEADTVEDDDPFFNGVSEWFSEKFSSTKLFWIIADIVLVILALVFLKMLFAKK
ncbi:putative S-layer protein [archaeon]|jgi:uncharacterized membrane protein|nr:putative S-layer protein [archaeon]MBT3731246.1 putative S-layer protein [archaeon]MBT4670000.1 putative S-layer protein [archaeon]MBT5287798.1 putative S-layer protein [archaeon]MBT7052364.1 putative S-layer protein [archaeon]